MIRFIEIGDQILEGATDFAWYDTVRDEFIMLHGICVWETWDDFVADLRDAYIHDPPLVSPDFPESRFRELFCDVRETNAVQGSRKGSGMWWLRKKIRRKKLKALDL